jgi:hypothetical protein
MAAAWALEAVNQARISQAIRRLEMAFPSPVVA